MGLFFFPLNRSLEQEMERLFQATRGHYCGFSTCANSVQEKWREEFMKNGDDEEYEEPCPPSPTELIPKVISIKKKKVLAVECVFCKNNGEDAKFYQSHVLKDEKGIVVCPILRRYICPVCHVNGDKAHTLKYCPLNNGKIVSPVTSLKFLKDSTGNRRRHNNH